MGGQVIEAAERFRHIACEPRISFQRKAKILQFKKETEPSTVFINEIEKTIKIYCVGPYTFTGPDGGIAILKQSSKRSKSEVISLGEGITFLRAYIISKERTGDESEIGRAERRIEYYQQLIDEYSNKWGIDVTFNRTIR